MPKRQRTSTAASYARAESGEEEGELDEDDRDGNWWACPAVCLLNLLCEC